MNSTEAAILGYDTAIERLKQQRDELVAQLNGAIASHVPRGKAEKKLYKEVGRGKGISAEGRKSISESVRNSWASLTPRQRRKRINKMNAARLQAAAVRRSTQFPRIGGAEA